MILDTRSDFEIFFLAIMPILLMSGRRRRRRRKTTMMMKRNERLVIQEQVAKTRH